MPIMKSRVYSRKSGLLYSQLSKHKRNFRIDLFPRNLLLSKSL